jgi:muramoyltetrapeptide carboxypeptidase
MLARVPLAFSPSLAPGDAIAVVAPSSPFPHDELWRGLAWLRARYRVHLRADALTRDGYLAGNDERRLGELSAALLDDEVKAVVAARGGYGALRLLAKLPWDRIAAKPKWIVGFSDITALHAMAWRAGIASVHSPNVTGLGRDSSVALRASWLAALERPAAPRAWENLGVVRGGTASGPLVGGNLTLVHAMAAAGRLAIPQGAVLALEEVSEAPYRIDRMLTSLELGGHFDRVAGLVFGSFTACDARADGRSAEDVLEEFGRRLGIPVLIDAPFGHGVENDSFVLGADVQIRANALVWNPR